MFEFNKENAKKANEEIKKYPEDRKESAIMAFLWLAQEQDGENFLSQEKIEYIAGLLDLPFIKVYEVASFYSMYNLEMVGKNHFQICGTVPCRLAGSRDIINACRNIFGIELNETTSDKLFTISEVECLGACTEAPVMQVNNKEYYTNLDRGKVIEVINKLKK